MIKALLLSVAVLAAANDGLNELKGQAGEPPTPAPAAAPAPIGEPANTLPCVMSLEYKESVTQLIILQLWKNLDGDAAVSCPGYEPVHLRLKGSGPSLGLGLPNTSPFKAVHGVTAGAISIRVPSPLNPQNLEGDYTQFGPSVGGVGLSPWVNSDSSLQMTIYLPADFNASAAINLQHLRLYLMP